MPQKVGADRLTLLSGPVPDRSMRLAMPATTSPATRTAQITRRHPCPRCRFGIFAAQHVEDIEVPRDRKLDDVVERAPVERFEPAWSRLTRRCVIGAIQTIGCRVRQRPDQICFRLSAFGFSCRPSSTTRQIACRGSMRLAELHASPSRIHPLWARHADAGAPPVYTTR